MNCTQVLATLSVTAFFEFHTKKIATQLRNIIFMTAKIGAGDNLWFDSPFYVCKGSCMGGQN